MEIPYIDFSREYADIAVELDAAYKKVMQKAWFILGEEVANFEKEFAAYSEAKHAVGLASGIDSLILPLDAWGLKTGDEVIVAANTYIATAFAATHLGARPVFVDMNENTYNIDVSKIESAITERTKVIAPTHLYGQMADMDPILELARKYNLKVLEDAAQSHGATYKGRKCGSHGDAVAFSFYPTKNLGCNGDGGMLTANDDKLTDILLHLRNNGSKTKFYYDYIGYNSRLDELQAALLRVKLKKLDAWNQRRRDLAKLYLQKLGDLEEIILPEVPEWSSPVWHVFCIRVLDGRRESLIEHLKNNSIGHNVHYLIPPHLQNCYKSLGYGEGDFPVTERTCKEILSLPLTPYHTEEEILHTVEVIKRFFAKVYG
jgi:dTDP-4-amino-4,6-dideoxygalactose transaminase